MKTQLDDLEEMVGAVLAKEELPTPEKIRQRIEQTRVVYPDVTDDQAENLARRFETIHDVKMDIGNVLKERDFEPWLGDARVGIDFYYWGRYRKLLAQKKFSGQVLATLDDVTDRTLGLLENPKQEGKWDRRGMVVGHVQSGKTANYTGLICKAGDAGYKVIIVIAGIHNNLRNQTQRRIDEGFIGFDSERMLDRTNSRILGVGRFDRTRRPNTFTSSLRDFDRAMATGVGIRLENLQEPVVFVIKKNTHTLKNLIEWLTEHNAKQGATSIKSPMLLIDDEADNASINIKRNTDEISRINGQIRDLLRVFDRSCYVGYTATPFANIFIDPDSDDEMFGEDLFPRDFIVSLDPPDNYVGAIRVFVENAENVVRHIEDNEDILPLKHRKNHSITGLPESLSAAVRTFIVARAIRLVRGHDGKHNSMLVNASTYNEVQRQIRNELHELVERIRSGVRVNGEGYGTGAQCDPEVAALHETFKTEYSKTCGISWSQVRERLLESVSPMIVVEVNRRSHGSLDYSSYKSGLNVIAVGGFSLSRGLTLQGLMVSYFLRNSMMYDTLMQMGRWFGYQPDYDDLSRVWMLEEAEGWYAHIADSIEELREEFRRMESANATPRQFGLKVRSHPDTLVVTARNKMGSGKRLVVSVGLANHFIETATLRPDMDSLEANRNAAILLARNLRDAGKAPEDGEPVSGGRLVCAAPVSAVTGFLAGFQNHPGSTLTETGPILKYINERHKGELRAWDILFAGISGRNRKGSLVDNSLGFSLACQRRSSGARSDKNALLITNKQRVASRGVEKVGLRPEQISKAEREYALSRNRAPGDKLNYPDRIYRSVRERPLLIVHLLDIDGRVGDLSAGKPVVAWSISFPKTDHKEEKAEYVVNSTWMLERYGDEVGEEEIEGDDD